ncbi:endonuclease/exonuclease/phosphatase family protein [Confluentibacter citreus]|uniref:endonuclease/exonuclease/phosphatase family protein n=1 Tax=Confluentibacter citreus TaxID=2007307 RepID=UPI000C28C753
MKIITWNCNMSFRKKAEFILNENPDIIIVPESESPEKLRFKKGMTLPNDVFWYGDNPNKGIGVYSYSDFKISISYLHNPDFRYVIPLSIKSNDLEFVLIAIWCQKPKSSDNYGTHTWNAINYYSELLSNEKVIIAGDFNSSSIWDKKNREANHSNIVYKLKDIGIESVYHLFYNEEQGKESNATLFMHRKIERPYHIDFCFASNYFINRLKYVSIGKYETWTQLSDHKPVICEFEN